MKNFNILYCILNLSLLPSTFAILYNPPITSPSSTTVWKAGSSETVSWDTSQIPSGYTGTAEIFLGYTQSSTESISYYTPLAKGFTLISGSVSFQLPSNISSKSSYFVALVGSSANVSPQFKINGKGKSNSGVIAGSVGGVVVGLALLGLVLGAYKYGKLKKYLPSSRRTASGASAMGQSEYKDDIGKITTPSTGIDNQLPYGYPIYGSMVEMNSHSAPPLSDQTGENDREFGPHPELTLLPEIQPAVTPTRSVRDVIYNNPPRYNVGGDTTHYGLDLGRDTYPRFEGGVTSADSVQGE